MELKDKLTSTTFDDTSFADQTADFTDGIGDQISEATEALLSLGFGQSEIQSVLKKKKDWESTEEIIRYALTELQRF